MSETNDDEIEVTPEMIEAATDAFYEHWDDDAHSTPHTRDVMREVVRSALQVARKS